MACSSASTLAEFETNVDDLLAVFDSDLDKVETLLGPEDLTRIEHEFKKRITDEQKAAHEARTKRLYWLIPVFVSLAAMLVSKLF